MSTVTLTLIIITSIYKSLNDSVKQVLQLVNRISMKLSRILRITLLSSRTGI